MDAFLLFAAVAVPGGFLAIRYWKAAIFSVFVLMVIEGALRKWVFPWAQAEIYLLKDAILLAAYVGFLLSGPKKQYAIAGLEPIKIALLLGFVFGCFEILNPNSPSILVGLVGVKTYFLYAPLAFILPYAIESREQLLRLIRNYLIMAIPIAVMGFVQVVAGPNSSLNVYVSYSEDAPLLATFGRDYDLIRATGTFSYISGYTAFLSFLAILAIGYNLAQGWRIKNNIAPMLALTLVVGAMFTTGSRAPVYILVATGPIILWLGVAGRILSAQTAMRMCLVVPIVAIVATSISSRAFEGFMDRATDSKSDNIITRIVSLFSETSGAIAGAPFLGFGIGTTHPSSLRIMGTDWPWWLQGVQIEVEIARVAAELGVIGLVLIYPLRFLIAWFAFRSAMSFKDPVYRALGIVLMVHLVAATFLGSITLNVTAAIYYWGALGLIVTMRRLEQAAPRQQATGKLLPNRMKMARQPYVPTKA